MHISEVQQTFHFFVYVVITASKFLQIFSCFRRSVRHKDIVWCFWEKYVSYQENYWKYTANEAENTPV